MNQRGLVGLPRNWRVITVASLTSLGLACGAGQSVQGEWWSLPKAKPETTKAAPAKPVPTENGFSPTIHRLMSDARQYAEKGELDKAVQLAERAAKISEASSQLLGPASDCSPEKTAQFANELRARRDAVAKRPGPAKVESKIAATVPKTQPAMSRPREIPDESPPPKQPEPLVVERAIAESVTTEQPAELAAQPRENKPAWAEELPPTPAPEPEPLNKPVKFRRSVLARAANSIDEDTDDSRSFADETPSSSSADVVIAETLETEFTDGLPIDLQPTVPDATTAEAKTSLNEITPPPTEANQPSLNGEIQPAATETANKELPPPPISSDSKPGWEDEAFAEELLLGQDSSEKLNDSSTVPPARATEVSAPPFPEDSFPVQRVVQLRRRLETATSFNPGGAYSKPASSLSEPVKSSSAASSSESVAFELPSPAAAIESSEQSNKEVTSADSGERPEDQKVIKSAVTQNERQTIRLREHRQLPDQVRTALLQSAASPEKADDEAKQADPAPYQVKKTTIKLEPASGERQTIRLREHRALSDHVRTALLQSAPSPKSSDDWMTKDDSNPHQENQTAVKSEPTSKERNTIRLRENRALPDQVRTALLQAATLPSSPSTRKHTVGYSEPMLWQSAPESNSVLPTLSITNGIGNEANGSHNSLAMSPPPDLRDPAHQSGSTDSNDKQMITAVTVEQTGFRSTEPSAGSIQLPEPSGPELSSSDIKSKGSAKRPTTTSKKTNTSKSKASHEIPRQAFAFIEPLAAALRLPIATTASILGGTGLALLGLGLLLVRVAIRSRHS